MDLNQVTVPSTNVAKAVEFYKMLGLRLIVLSLPKYARFELPDGNSTFSIHLEQEKFSQDGTLIYFECKDLDEKVRELQELGIGFDKLPRDESWLWREARLKDPDGNRLCLYFAGENRKYPPWRID
jgi:catechol 2,3-dioxygenase-like lactoylglutathione lyase family enzyme